MARSANEITYSISRVCDVCGALSTLWNDTTRIGNGAVGAKHQFAHRFESGKQKDQLCGGTMTYEIIDVATSNESVSDVVNRQLEVSKKRRERGEGQGDYTPLPSRRRKRG